MGFGNMMGGFGDMGGGGGNFMMSSSTFSSGGPGGQPYSYSSSSQTVMRRGPNGEMISESKGVQRDSSGRSRMSHQRRIGDRAATYTKQRRSRNDDWEMNEDLREVTHADRDAFNTEFSTKMRSSMSDR